ncbi:MAG TPA: SRPBCC family protein [Candidatus Saccharimonadales bacterium]|nr:SRPBCC family protein [Candidatus Saccharimonadales bacterium]
MNKATVTTRPGEPFVVIERDFDAPRDKVFRAFTEKELVKRWWVGPGYEVSVELLDARDGGAWRFVQRDKDGKTFAFHGSFHRVSPELTIQTFEFDGMPEPGHVSLDKMMLTEKDGKTHMRVESVFMSVADRDGMIASGMEEGMQHTYNTLDDVLKEMA